MRLAVVTGTVLVLAAGTGAAYAVVDSTTVSPTVAGNGAPIDDNHSAKASVDPGDDRGGATPAPGHDGARHP